MEIWALAGAQFGVVGCVRSSLRQRRRLSPSRCPTPALGRSVLI